MSLLKKIVPPLGRWMFAMFAVSLAAVTVPARAISWFPLGPYGGDARSFAADAHDPKHIYLGTATGWLYESHDGGGSWARLAQIDQRSDLLIKQILTDPRDPQHLVVGAYSADRPDGGIFTSADGGHTWVDQPEMHGQSIRSLTRAPSSPNILAAGTLQGVFRSLDDGRHWTQISPQGSTEIHEIESVAFDPANPAILYAGTWHLPWKTTDGGAHWQSIKKGIIEDSDVFSIIIDPRQTNVVYASACSGIYKSTDAGAEFKGGVTINKLQGIPSSSRRTRKLMQDPQHLQTVYAGTTEGLFRTLDGGVQWDRVSGTNVVVNDVYVDPTNPDHILLATDRGGVLASDDFAISFHPSNTGFSARQVTSFAVDPHHPAVVYVGVVNDKETGGVFVSRTGGLSWSQESDGLGGRDIFSLGTTPDGVLLAGTNHGIFRLADGFWVDSSAPMAAHPVRRRAPPGPGPHAAAAAPHAAPLVTAERLDDTVYSLAQGAVEVYAATSNGLLRSNVDATQWEPVRTLMPETRYVAVRRSTLLVAGLKHMALSQDGGTHWTPLALPASLTQIATIAVDDQNTLWVGGRQGVFYSPDNGASWRQLKDLNINEVDGVFFDAAGSRVLITCANSDVVFAVNTLAHTVNYWDSGWRLRFARPMGDYLLGITLYDGVVVQPKMVDSSVAAAKTAAAK
jgi:photosystem II stability/assembly factor-like uncharacterized protein